MLRSLSLSALQLVAEVATLMHPAAFISRHDDGENDNYILSAITQSCVCDAQAP